LHPEDNHWIISTDTDYDQLITDRVVRYNGVGNELVTLNGYLKENGKPVLDKEKNPKLLEDPQYLLFKKIVRGDSSDNIFASYPGAREIGSKNKVGIKEAYEDRNKQGFNYNNFMLQRFTDHEGVEHRVRDDFERNRTLIDLTAQPDDVKLSVDTNIREGVRRTTIPQVGIHLMKFCGKYELNKISDNAETYAKWLNSPYTGVLA
jgi:5'-3' exonuclease